MHVFGDLSHFPQKLFLVSELSELHNTVSWPRSGIIGEISLLFYAMLEYSHIFVSRKLIFVKI